MGRENKGNRKLLIITIILLFIICSIICALVFIYKNYNVLVSNNNEFVGKIEISIKEKEKYINEVNNAKNELSTLKESITKINEIKDKYYTDIRKLEDKILKGETDKKIAYLTIDDGPYTKTYDFLKVLKEYDAPATFFVLLKSNKDDTYKAILDNGHSLGNHTASHTLGKNGVYASTESFVNDVHKLDNYLLEHFNYKPTLFRFPGGSLTAGSLKLSIANTLKNEGYAYVDWNVIVGDGSDVQIKQKSPYEWYKEQSNGKNIITILMHDYSDPTLQDLPKILKDLKDNGYLILPLSNKSIMVN